MLITTEIESYRRAQAHSPQGSPAWYHWGKLLAKATREWRKNNTLIAVK